MAIIHANEDNFDSLINDNLVLVDFFANWCGPCKMLSPILEGLADERGALKVVKVDVDECSNLAKNYGIMSIPTLFLFKNGKLVSKKIGFMPEIEIKEWIKGEQ